MRAVFPCTASEKVRVSTLWFMSMEKLCRVGGTVSAMTVEATRAMLLGTAAIKLFEVSFTLPEKRERKVFPTAVAKPGVNLMESRSAFAR